MRGKVRPRAAFWLVPALASAASLPPTFFPVASTSISRPLFSEDGTPGPFEASELTFRVDVLESQEACGHANVTVNGQTLPQEGHGHLPYDPWTSLVATWTSACVEWDNTPREQLLNLVIDSVNGSIVQDLRLRVLFQQIAPVQVSEATGRAAAAVEQEYAPHETIDGEEPPASEGLDTELAELERLREHATEVERLIAWKEQRIREAYGWDDEQPQTCDSWRCLVQSLLEKVTGAAVNVFGGLSGHHHHKGDHHGSRHCGHGSGNHTFPHPHHPPHRHESPPPQQPPRQPDEKPSVPDSDLPNDPIGHTPSDGPEHPIMTPGRPDAPEHPIAPDGPLLPDMPEPPRQPVHSVRPAGDSIRTPRAWHVLLLVKVFAVISMFLFVLHLFVRCNRSCAARRERQRQRRVAREARRASRAARREANKAAIKAALKKFVRRLFPGLAGDEEKAAMVRQPESDTESDLGNTMEQEIAQFRAAANVVGDMISAAEEGRTQQRRRRCQYQPPPEDYTPTPPSPGAFAEYMPEDDIPPAYEERRRSPSISAEASMVSNGFRYTPGSGGITPSSGASQPGGADDEPPRY